MDILELCNLLGDISGYKIHPIQFPNIDEDCLVKLEITTGMIEQGGVFDFNIELGVKAYHPKSAERICINMINKLHKVTDREYKEYQLILMLAEKPYPFFEGILDDGSFYFTCNFRVMTCVM